ncbi:MAG: serine/threonine-protein kinase [Pseudooceanicola sp.]
MAATPSGGIFQPGDLLNNTYRIEKLLGRGGTSEVYRARSEISGRVIAIKALKAEYAINEDFLALMTREEDIRDVRHDAVVRYFDTQRMQDGVVYLVMDYVDGPGLDRKLAEGGMSAGDLMIVGERVCQGLIAAHERNIIHRDLSPDNIILRDDDPAEAVIIDFGIAKDTNPGAETIVGNEFAGKYAYAAPEQLSGRTDPRSDIYSLGALLLSTFRGRKPDIGNNPMEVVQRKAEPLDLEGVPDPLRRLIAKMTHPDPDQRFATARDLLAGFRDPDSVEAPAPAESAPSVELDDATVIAPVATSRPPSAETPPPPASEPRADRSTPEAPAAKGGRGGMFAVLALVLLAAIGGGGYAVGPFDGLLGPRYPAADPYTLVVQRQFGSDPQAVGNVPSPEIEAALSDRMASIGGGATLTLATGNIAEDWGTALLDVVEAALPLEEFRIAVQNDELRLTGLAHDAEQQATIRAAFSDGMPGAFSGSVDIGLGPRFLDPATLEPVLASHADCGRLQLQSPPPVGYGLDDQIIVTGRFAEAATREAVAAEIAAMAGDRPVRVEAEVLNESLCRVDDMLPRAGPGGFDLRFGFGDQEGENLSGRYKVGDNPVIDLRLPEDVQSGFLYVSVVDVKGVVFHLLPNRVRPENSVEALRADADEDGFVRVAYGLDEAQGTGRIAFNVDGSVLGKSKVIVLHSDRELFDELRPTTESAESYADALRRARDVGGLSVNSIDSAILTTER